jgi:hypothetical protein
LPPGTQSTLTDLSGRFTLAAYKGVFQVCWKAPGFVDGCDGQGRISAGGPLVNAGTVRIPLPVDPSFTAVYGAVSLTDGSPPRRFSPLDSVNAFARVKQLDKNGATQAEAYVNNFGEYLLPAVPAKDPISLVASLEKAEVRQDIQPDANLAGSRWQRIDLRLGNTPPRVDPLIATDSNGRWVKAAAPDAQVKLTARTQDADGHALSFQWRVDDGSGSLVPSGASATWTLPNTRGHGGARRLRQPRGPGLRARHALHEEGERRHRWG